jgi:hypothetical protein
MPVAGGTVTLVAEFKTPSGEYRDQEKIELSLYNSAKRPIGNTTVLRNSARVGRGKYYYDYIMPEGIGPVYYEFKGYLEGKITIGRGVLNRDWV